MSPQTTSPCILALAFPHLACFGFPFSIQKHLVNESSLAKHSVPEWQHGVVFCNQQANEIVFFFSPLVTSIAIKKRKWKSGRFPFFRTRRHCACKAGRGKSYLFLLPVPSIEVSEAELCSRKETAIVKRFYRHVASRYQIKGGCAVSAVS